MPVDLNQIAQSFYNTWQSLNKTATETVGVAAMWCRALPHKNSEDVILQEYTLTNVECPKQIKVVTVKNDFNPGTLSIDLFGINYEAPFEIAIDLNTWLSVYGPGSQPQKGDIVYIAILNKIFEVATATVSYAWAEQPTGFKCQLVKYSPHASRREAEDLKSTISDLTVSQEDLFGEEISKQVADIVDIEQFSPNNSTIRDTIKDFDSKAIVMETLSVNGNVFSVSHYDFSKASKPTTYSAVDDGQKKYRLFTAWVKLNNSMQHLMPAEIKKLYNKNKVYWQFKIATNGDFNTGDTVELVRGSLLSITGKIESKSKIENSNKTLYLVDFPTHKALELNKRMTEWWTLGNWSIYSESDNTVFSSDKLEVSCNKGSLDINGVAVKNIQIMPDKWQFLAILLDKSIAHSYLFSSNEDGQLVESAQGETLSKLSDFSSSSFSCGNAKSNIEVANVRYYALSKKPSVKSLKEDAVNRFSFNSSFGVILDNADIVNKEEYYSRSK